MQSLTYSTLSTATPAHKVFKPGRHTVRRLATAALLALVFIVGAIGGPRIFDLAQKIVAAEQAPRTVPVKATENAGRRVNINTNNGVPVHAFRWR
jgi:hypothetical protein